MACSNDRKRARKPQVGGFTEILKFRADGEAVDVEEAYIEGRIEAAGEGNTVTLLSVNCYWAYTST